MKNHCRFHLIIKRTKQFYKSFYSLKNVFQSILCTLIKPYEKRTKVTRNSKEII